MIFNIFHFTAVLTTFFFTLAGKLQFAIISFCLALLLTLFTLVGKNNRSKSDNRNNNNQQVEDGQNPKLTEVLISKTYGDKKKFEKYYQREFRPDNIPIDKSLPKTVSKPFPLIWCWILLLLGLATWGTYNFIYRDEPYVPLSRVYEDFAPQKTHSDIALNHKYQKNPQKESSNAPKVKPATIPESNDSRPPINAQKRHSIANQPLKKETPNTIKKKGAIYSWTDERGVTHHSNIVPPDFSDKVTTRPEINSSYNTTPIKLLNGRPLIAIKIRHNGKSIDFEIIIDTGSSTTIIPNEIANYIKPDFVRETYSNVADGRRVEGKLMIVDSIIVGPKSVDNIQVITGRVAGSKNKGLLGMNFIKHHPFYIDIDNKVIHWK